MLIEIDGTTTELKRVDGVKPNTEKINVFDISREAVMMEVPYLFVPEKHYAILDVLFAEFWKESWTPERVVFTPESGEWEVGITVTDVLTEYASYFIHRYWGGRRARYLGVDADADSSGLDHMRVYCTISIGEVIDMLESGNLDKRLFEKRYKAWLEANPDVDYRGSVDATVGADILAGVDPAVWGIMLSCSKGLIKELGANGDMSEVFSGFITSEKARVKTCIYAMSPSERKQCDDIAAELAAEAATSESSTDGE